MNATRSRGVSRWNATRSGTRSVTTTKPASHSYLYDEWDMHAQSYLRGWCRLYERRTDPGDAAAVIELLKRIAPHEQRVRRHSSNCRCRRISAPSAYSTAKNSIGISCSIITPICAAARRPDERVYQRRDRVTRDVAAAFLIDLSASTDDPVVPPQTTVALGPDGKPADDDDPFLWQPVRSTTTRHRRGGSSTCCATRSR